MTAAGNEQERRDALPHGAALRDYTIEDVLGHGGFGIVYRARHNELGNVVAVKEYLPIELALREGASVHPRSAACRAGYEDGLRRFRDEARALIEFQSHPSIVSCREFFRANGTAYLVMEYEEGMPLSELLRRREASGRPFDEADLLAVMVPLLEGLQRVHEAGMLHRDIKPSNILVRRSDERPVLIDFGAAKQMAAERSKSLAPYTEGYAALEQVGEGDLGPWTDLYAVGAVMWRIVAGGNLPWEPLNPVKVEKRANAVVRATADPMPSARKLGAGRFSPGVLKAIDRCLKLNEKERLRDCGELLALLRGDLAAAKTPVSAASMPPPQARSRKRPWKMLTAAGVALAAALTWLALASWNSVGEIETQAAFRIEAEPAGAVVELLNTPVPYRAGMQLAPGRYEIEVSAPGYETRREAVEHGESGTSIRIALEKMDADRAAPDATADAPQLEAAKVAHPEPEPVPAPKPAGPPRVVMATSLGDMTIELYPDKAPETVKNFLQYVDDKFYDGTIFHRVIPGFMIQGGGFEPGMREKPTREPVKNESANGLSNLRYTIAMARTTAPHSATVQFFINHVTNRALDRDQSRDGWGYCVFGKVTEGSETVESIAQVSTGNSRGHANVPTSDVRIESVRHATDSGTRVARTLAPKRIRVGGNVANVRLLRQVRPQYPPLARQARIQGTVKLSAIIDKDGTIQKLEVTNGHPLLVPAALAAVKQWRYKPTLLNGEAVEVLTDIDVNFTLSR